MTLAARFDLCRGALALRVELTVEPGRTLALVGPNGAGKTTVLQVLAGLLPIDAGEVVHGGRTLDGGPGGPFLGPAARDVGLVFQEHLLFPHLTALENVAYGLRARGVGRRAARETARGWLERVGLGPQADVRPAALSGGQAQRVALARALAPGPRLLLLDEPLAAVDASARVELRRELREHLGSFPGERVVVAHDALDAFALADRIAVLEDGRIVQADSLERLCAHPSTPYVADLVGLNLFEGEVTGGCLVTAGGGRLVVAGAPEGHALAALHPRAVALYREEPDGSPRNVWRAPVAAVEPAVDRLRVRLAGPLPLVAEVTPAAAEALALRPGAVVWVAVKATEVRAWSA